MVTNAFSASVPVLSSNAVLSIQAPALLGEWLNGTTAATNLNNVSGYWSPKPHNLYTVGAGSYAFTNDVPPG